MPLVQSYLRTKDNKDGKSGSDSLVDTSPSHSGRNTGRQKMKSRKKLPLSDSEHDDYDLFKNDMKEMLSTMFSSFLDKQNERMKTIEDQLFTLNNQTAPIPDIEKSMNFISDQLSDMQVKIKKLEEEKKELKEEIVGIQGKIDVMERQARKTCIEIRGVPRKQGEKKNELFSMIGNLLSTLKVEYTASDIRDVYRVPNKNNANISSLVAELSSTLTKSNLLNMAKKHNLSSNTKLSTRHLGLEGPAAPIYVSEHLTPKSRRLYFLARELARAQNFSYCWSSDGMIYLRKKEGLPHILVKNEAQLDALRNSK